VLTDSIAEIPTVSVVTPAWNVVHFLPETIRSMMGQSLTDWEWIIVDDGSTDRTRALLESLKDPRIRIIFQQTNGGASAARNTGLDIARGRYVTFLDADDVLPAGALRARASYLDMHSDVDVVSGPVAVTSQGRSVRHYRPSTLQGPLLPRLARLDETVFFGVCYMLRRACIGTCRFRTNMSHCEDIAFFLELAATLGLTYGAVSQDIYEYRLREGSAMSDLDGIEQGYLELLAHARRLPNIGEHDLLRMRGRIASIMFKSWVRRGRPVKAGTATFRALTSAWWAK